MALSVAPDQEAFVASVEDSFHDAIADARACPRMWSVHAERLATDHDLIGPYFLWRLLIDRAEQRKGYGTAVLDAIVDYLATRPGAAVLWTSAGRGPGTPQPFYERYGFVMTGEIMHKEVVLRLDLPVRPG